ncbi:MAG: DUF2330 domain-containing protein [Myxococcota bacterium]
MRLTWTICLGVVCGVSAMLLPQRALACGGCFIPISEEGTVVTGHRMAISISPSQSVLWDQIEYDGNPADFAWVLPVTEGARIEVSTDAWFEVLEAATAVQVSSPQLNCSGGGGLPFFGCASAGASDSLAAERAAGGGVTVLHEGTVGPYETVTLRSTIPGALVDWLQGHDYAIDESITPVIDSYVTDGWDFIAMRLQPGASVRQMKPVRVVFPGPTFSFPLRMVAAGTGANTALTIFVIGEGRWQVDGFTNTTVDMNNLSWDFNNGRSNYTELRQQALETNDRRGWLTTYAKPGTLLSPVTHPVLGGQIAYSTDDGRFESTIANAYISQGFSNREENEGEWNCREMFNEFANRDDLVVDTCTADGGCGNAGAGEIAADQLKCGKLDDVAAALVGMHPRAVWVGRLEANLPREAFNIDLALQAASTQEPVENLVQAQKAENPPCPVAGSLEDNATRPPPSTDPLAPLVLLVVMLAMAMGAARLVVRPATANS